MKIALIADNIHFREDLKFFIENKLVHNVISEAANGEEFRKSGNGYKADVVLMDITLDKIGGFDVAKKTLINFPQLRIIAITMNTEAVVMAKLFDTGFKGFIFKTEIFKTLETVLQSVYSDEFVFSDKLQIW
ncbi:MAG: response regulator transcription factor [Bacteroidetes bacterium]|nr:response regulator transcription factor [Bacteroidota bacterium]